VRNIEILPSNGRTLWKRLGMSKSPTSMVYTIQNSYNCRELTTLWVARLDDGTELKVTDPKKQQRDVEEEEAEDEERRERVDGGR